MVGEEQNRVVYKLELNLDELKGRPNEELGQIMKEMFILRTHIQKDGFHIEYSGPKYAGISATTTISGEIGKLLTGIIKEGDPITPELHEEARVKLEKIVNNHLSQIK